MKQEPKHPLHGQSGRSEPPPVHTPESRAREGVSPGFREAPPASERGVDLSAQSREAAHSDAGNSAPSHGSPAVTPSAYDPTFASEAAAQASGTPPSPTSETAAPEATPDPYAYYPHLRDNDYYTLSGAESDDPYRRHLYDDYYLQDDYYYQDDYYPQQRDYSYDYQGQATAATYDDPVLTHFGGAATSAVGAAWYADHYLNDQERQASPVFTVEDYAVQDGSHAMQEQLSMPQTISPDTAPAAISYASFAQEASPGAFAQTIEPLSPGAHVSQTSPPTFAPEASSFVRESTQTIPVHFTDAERADTAIAPQPIQERAFESDPLAFQSWHHQSMDTPFPDFHPVEAVLPGADTPLAYQVEASRRDESYLREHVQADDSLLSAHDGHAGAAQTREAAAEMLAHEQSVGSVLQAPREEAAAPLYGFADGRAEVMADAESLTSVAGLSGYEGSPVDPLLGGASIQHSRDGGAGFPLESPSTFHQTPIGAEREPASAANAAAVSTTRESFSPAEGTEPLSSPVSIRDQLNETALTPEQASAVLQQQAGEAFALTPENVHAELVGQASDLSSLLVGEDTLGAIPNPPAGETIPSILFAAPTESQLKNASTAAEQLIWQDNGVACGAEVDAMQVLIEDHGAGKADGRFAWAVAEPGEPPILRGSSATMADAKVAAILQASLHGFIQEDELRAAMEPSSSGDAPGSAEIGAETRRTIDGLLTDPDRLMQSESYLLTSQAEIQTDRETAASTLKAAGKAEDVLQGDRSNDPGDIGKLSRPFAAGALTLGVLGLAGKATVGAVKTAGEAAVAVTDRALREDETLSAVPEAADFVRGGIHNLQDHSGPADKRTLAESLLIAQRDKVKTAAGMAIPGKGQIDGKAAGILARDRETAVDAKELFLSKEGKTLDPSSSLLENGPTGLRKEAVKAGKEKSAEKLLLKEKDGKDKGSQKSDKKAVTERDRKRQAKKALKKAQKTEKSKAMSVVNEGKGLGAKGALFTAGVAKEGAKKVIASGDETLATALTMAEKTKSVVGKTKQLLKLPNRIALALQRAARTVVQGFKLTVAAITGTAPVGFGILLPLFLIMTVVMAVVVILCGMATILNEEQEISEVSALVAELDEDLTKEIQQMDGAVLYADARNTYRMKNKDGGNLTINADLRDDESDLREVNPESITVQTNPAEIIAYIDAKYDGDWQVGAASWKYTIDAFGKTWNIIQWDNMPEWARKALNKSEDGEFRVAMQLFFVNYLQKEWGVDEEAARDLSLELADQMADLVFDKQVQGLTEEVVIRVVQTTCKAYRDDLDVTDDEAKKLYYEMSEIITDIIAEFEPVALVYDEIVAVHQALNFWSEEYQEFEHNGGMGGGLIGGGGDGSGGVNKYGYPNSSGYDEDELAAWDGYNEVSVYGVSEAGTTSVTADGTRITNTWADTNMAIACEGLQNKLFAYWTSEYKEATGLSNPSPVKITMYNPATGQTVTAEVRDCGGWRGFNPNYMGRNGERQWDLLPAVWKALGGGQSAGTMKVYWKVDPDATVGGGAGEPEPITIEDYPWVKESDEKDGAIEITHPTYIAHGIQDLLNNGDLLDEIMGKEDYEDKILYGKVRALVVGKVQTVMKTMLSIKNSEGDEFVDYLYMRRELGNPFGKQKNGKDVEWVVTHRYNPGYEHFDHDEAYVRIKPLGSAKTVRCVLEGEVEKVEDGKVTVVSEVDTATSIKVEYSKLEDVDVEKGDEVKKGTKLGKMSGDTLRIAYYEVNDAALQPETKKKWAYDAALFMQGFAGYVAPDEPTDYTGSSGGGGGGSLADCKSIVDFARSRLGCPYVWGATGPKKFDCSGLTQWCYAKCGISIPRNSEQQYDTAAKKGKAHKIDETKMQPGDILWKSGHVGIYIGNNQYIHAPQTGDVVKVSTGIHYFTHYLVYAR